MRYPAPFTFLLLGACLWWSCGPPAQTVEPEAEAPQARRVRAELSVKTGGEWVDRKYKGGEFVNVPELRVPAEHTDHSEFIRYEGPGWESDKVGYRLYLDWRNAIDIFGKKTDELVLHDVGQDGFQSYHEPAEWGMDVLKVGKSLGLGSLAFWDGTQAQRVADTDSLYCGVNNELVNTSSVKVNYYGWGINDKKTDLETKLSITTGSRFTRYDASLSSPLPNLCTGIVKHDQADLLQYVPQKPEEWGYLATFGNQSLDDASLGLAVIFKKGAMQAITADSNSHVVVLTPDNDQLTYYFGAAWEHEPQGITSKAAFEEELRAYCSYLNNPDN